MFDNLDYARGRLVNTLVRVGEEPVFITGLNRTSADVVYLKDPTQEVVVRAKELNLEAVPLGYIELNKQAFFAMRKPMRREWRQGLRMNSLFFTGGAPFLELPPTETRRTILGMYTPLNEIEGRLKKGYHTVAFHRHWAVDANSKCLYKDRVVGSYNGGVTLNKQSQYLGEHLQEVLDHAHG